MFRRVQRSVMIREGASHKSDVTMAINSNTLAASYQQEFMRERKKTERLMSLLLLLQLLLSVI